jgi:hypothetical protein
MVAGPVSRYLFPRSTAFATEFYMYRIWTALLALGLATSCLADENLYVCDALTVLELSESGALEHSNFAKAIAMHQSRFAVDRKTEIVTQ